MGCAEVGGLWFTGMSVVGSADVGGPGSTGMAVKGAFVGEPHLPFFCFCGRINKHIVNCLETMLL